MLCIECDVKCPSIDEGSGKRGLGKARMCPAALQAAGCGEADARHLLHHAPPTILSRVCTPREATKTMSAMASGAEAREGAGAPLPAGLAETWRQAFLLLVQSVGLNWRAVREARAERDEERREKEAMLDFVMDQALRDVDEEDGDEHEEVLGELLREASDVGHVALVRRVLAEGADVDAENGNGITALQWAAVGDDCEEVVRVLLEAGAAPNNRDQLGLTALHGTTSVPIARLLLAAGADPSLRDNTGRTALDMREEGAADEDDSPQFRKKNAAVARMLTPPVG